MPDTVAIIGGTGDLGFGLAVRWAAAGDRVLIGSRDAPKGQSAAGRLKRQAPEANVEGLRNDAAAEQASLIVLAVPLAAQIATMKSIRGSFTPETIVVDTTVPLARAIGGRLSAILPLWEGSAAQQAARYLGPHGRLVSAFHCLSATSLIRLNEPVHSDVLIAGDDPEARSVVAAWVRKIQGARPIDAGGLENARYAEHLAALLISLNLRHKAPSSGVRFTGLLEDGEDG